MSNGILIAIEGTDGSGKHTQTALLCEKLIHLGLPVKQLSFPRYESESSNLVKMYLNGEFGEHANDVTAYAASTFYAIDRYASFKDDWQKDYDAGHIIITDRYTISNAIHQGGKLPPNERDAYLDWLYDFEFNKIGIPRPDIVFYLDIPTEVSIKLRTKREHDTNTKPDIHEKDANHLRNSRLSALQIAAKSDWRVVNCATDDGLDIKPVDVIHGILLQETVSLLKTKGFISGKTERSAP